MKTLLLSGYNSQENALELELNHDHLSARNSMQKYTLRRHWVECIATGASKGNLRYCYSTYDSNRSTWCTPKKGTSSLFVAMFEYTDERGNQDINTLHVSRYDDAKRIRELFTRYDMSDAQYKELDDLANIKEKVSKAYDNAKKEALETMATNRTKLPDYEFNRPYSKSEITKCTDNIHLLAIRVEGYAVKKRCRKSEYFNDTLHFVLPTPDAIRESAKMANEKALIKASEHLANTYRTVKNANVTAKPMQYQAPRELGGFYGMQSELMARPIDAIKVI